MKTPIRYRALLVPALILGLSAVAPAAWSQSRPGTIEDLQPIQNRGEDESEQKRRGRTIGERVGKFGGLAASVGLTMGGHSEAGLVGTTVATNHGDRIGGAIGERVAGEGPTTRYMVKVRLDGGRVLNVTQLREQVDGMAIGSRVVVDGTGDQARLRAE